MLSRQNKLVFLKLMSLFSVVRGYNILVIVLAQYLASIYIFAPKLPISQVLLNPELFLIVLASALAIASGYIINNFYDAEKDLINRPHKTLLDNYVSQKTKLTTYFILNFLAVFLASAVSFRAVVFFSVDIFFLWFYSHKLKKHPFVGNLTASILAIVPFFAVFIYYRNFDLVIFVHATYLFLILSMRELFKDLENLRGDFAHNYRTIPIVYGIKTTKIVATFTFLLSLVPTVILFSDHLDVGYMKYYFVFSFLVLCGVIICLWYANTRRHYLWLHNILKLIIVLGVCSILLINVHLLVHRLF